jgi:hypothetical protein
MQDRYDMFIPSRRGYHSLLLVSYLWSRCGLGSLGAFNWKEDSHTNLVGVDIGCLFLVNYTLPA